MITVMDDKDIKEELKPWLERFGEESGKKLVVSGLEVHTTLTVGGKVRIVGQRNSSVPFTCSIKNQDDTELIKKLVRNLLDLQRYTWPWHVVHKSGMLTNGLANVRKGRASAKLVMNDLSSYYLTSNTYVNFTGPVSEFEEDLFPTENIEEVRELLTELYALRAAER